MNQSIALPNPAVEGSLDLNTLPFDNNLYDAYFYHSDHLGSSNYISNNTGIVSQHTEYLPFGETFVDEHLNSHNTPFKFNAKEFDDETGNYYYGARYYNPKWSTWLSVDPLVEKTMDAYAYCYQNPINFVDPTGMSGESTGVNQNKDGSYTVVNAKDDGDNGVYIADSNGNYDIKTSRKIAETMRPTDFMKTDDSKGTFSGHRNITFNLNNLTVSGSVKVNKHITATIINADGQKLLNWGQELFREELERQSPATFYGQLEILRDMSGNLGPLDFKDSMGLDRYTAIKVGETGGENSIPIITTLRALGNITFGANMRYTKPGIFSVDFYYGKVMSKVGEYNQNQNKGNGYNSGHPYYGEHTYSGSYIHYGYFNSFYKK